MKDLKKHLIEKGWKKSDINKTIRIIEKVKESKNPKIKILDKAVYWFSLLITLIGNFVISISLIPILIILEGTILYVVIIILGVSFGLLFELLIRTLENLETKHHLFLGIIIPTITIINFIIVSNNMGKLIGVEPIQDPIVIGAIYSIAFILPYISYQFFLKGK
jgi:hypothetical protein